MLPLGVLETGLLAFGLSMDSFAAAVGKGAGEGCARAGEAARVGICFGLFQAAMPVFGWTLGMAFAGLIESIDHWVAFGLLALIGANMVRNALGADDPDEGGRGGAGGLLSLLGLGLATSIDAAVVGVGLGAVGTPILATAMVIGAVTFSLSCAGVMAGRFAGSLLGKRAELAGGLMLIGLGLKILLEHLLA